MSVNPLISVVIPAYNAASYVADCIQNIQSQTYKNLEIIVVDDGSLDDTLQIASSYSVRVISQENSGPSVARNTGMDEASGEYIHFMDVDDMINLEYYEKMVEAILIAKSDIACGDMINEEHHYKTRKFKRQAIYYSTEDKLNATFVGKLGYVWRYLFRLDFIKEHGLRFEEGRVIEDLTFSLPAVFYAKSLITVPGAQYIYRYHTSSLMNNKEEGSHEKRRLDWSHAMAFRKDFSNQHNIKIPGVDIGRGTYLLGKLWKQLSGFLFKN